MVSVMNLSLMQKWVAPWFPHYVGSNNIIGKKGAILPFSILVLHGWAALAREPAANFCGPRDLPEQTQRSLSGFGREVLDHRSFFSNQVCPDFFV